MLTLLWGEEDRSSQKMESKPRSFFQRVYVVSGIVATVVGVLLFQKNITDAYDATMKTFSYAPRPYFHVRMRSESTRSETALGLLQLLHGSDICVLATVVTDMRESGWNADLAVSYMAKEEDGSCEPIVGSPPSLAFFTPSGFTLRHAGSYSGQDGGLPFLMSAAGPFIFQMFTGTDRPFVHIWYLHRGEARAVENFRIDLTDYAEFEYNLEFRPVPGGIIGWGTPNGLFHLLIGQDGTATAGRGMPPGMRSRDAHAVSLHWDFETFRRPPENVGLSLPSSASANAWEEYAGVEREGDGVVAIQLGRLDRLYVTSCAPVSGFSTSDAQMPGALIPHFQQQPRLECSGRGEDHPPVTIQIKLRQ